MSNTENNSIEDKVLYSMLKWLEAYGEVIKAIGEYEESTGKSIDKIFEEIIKPEFFTEILKQLPPEQTGKLFSLMFETYRLVSLTRDLQALDPKKKKEIGKNIVNTVNELKKLLEEIRLYFKKSEDG